MLKTPQYFIFDFDSTFIKSEGMEELASIALENNPQKNNILKQISDITEKGMTGEIPFEISLEKRIQLLNAEKSHIKKLNTILKKKISSSILRNKQFFKTYKDNIYIISGGFKEFIQPLIESFGIAPDHIFANTFIYDEKGTIIGADTQNPLANDQGKAKAVSSLNLKGDIYMIGDGYTDYQVKKQGQAQKFIAFTENVERKIATKNADHVAHSFDDFISFINNHY